MSKIKIFELDIDVDAVLKSQTELKKRLDRSKESLDALKKSGDTSSRTYVELQAETKALNREYNASQTQLGKLLELQGKEIKTVKEAENALSIINKRWSETKQLYGENSIQAEQLAAKHKELKDRTVELRKGIGDTSTNIGRYSEGVKEAFEGTSIFSGGLSGMIQKSEESGGALNLVKGGLKGAATGMWGITKATLAFIATPIGAILAVLVGAFALVKSALNRSEDSTNKLMRAFSGFSGITNKLLKFLEPLGEFLIDGIVKGFELAEKAIFKGIDAIASGLELLGFEEQAAALRKFNIEVQESSVQAKELADAEAFLRNEQRKSGKIQKDYQREAEKLRQIRDDESKSIQERVAANEELGKTLKKQLEEELRIAQLNLEVNNIRIEQEGRTQEALDAQAEALEAIADIRERITGQESEQLTNRVQLQKDAAQQQKEIADKAIAEQEAQLQLFIQQQGHRKKTLEEQLKVAEDVYKKEVDILKANLKNRNVTETEYDAELLRLKNELASQRAEVAVQAASQELQAYLNANQSRIDAETRLTDEVVKAEEDRLQRIKEKQQQYHKARLLQGEINETEYNEKIDEINEQNRIKNEELKTAQKEQEKEADLIDLENKRILGEENFLIDLENRRNELERQRRLEIKEAETTGADVNLINAKYAAQDKLLKEEALQYKLGLAQNFLGRVSGLLDQESALGKSVAIASVIADKAAAISQIVSKTGAANAAAVLASPLTFGQPWVGINTAKAAISSGLAAAEGAKAISQIKKAEKGALFSIGGKRHSQGGTKFIGEDGTAFEAEQGELIGVMNRNAARLFMDFNNMHLNSRTASTPNYFADGGIVTRSFVQSNTQRPTRVPEVDYDRMAASFKDAVSSLPSPITSVEDIISSVSKRNSIVDGANI
jgi:hypothetical protein